MKTLLLCPSKDYRNHPEAKRLPWLKMSLPFRQGIYEPLCQIGRVTNYDYISRMLEDGAGQMNAELLSLVGGLRPEYVLWVAFRESNDIRPETFDAMRKVGSKVIAWFFDDNLRFETYSCQWLPHVDYVLTDTPDCVAKYEALGKTAAFALPIPDIQPSQVEPKYGVSFVGDLRANRQQYLAALKAEGINVHLFGAAEHNFLPYEDMLRVFAGSRINLNFARTYDGSQLGIKARVFEVCMAGGFLMTEFTPGLPGFFLPGVQVGTFVDAADLVGKVRYYLEHDQERRDVANLGAAHARQYTARAFLERAFEKWGIA